MSETVDGTGLVPAVEADEGGVREALVLGLPALIAVQSGINRPRYPALSHVLRARKQPLITVPSETPGDGWDQTTHVVNNAMAVKAPGVWHRQSHEPGDRAALWPHRARNRRLDLSH